MVYPLADVKCKKDTGEVFKRTVRDKLAEGINRVEHGKVKFSKDAETGKWKCNIIDKDHVDFNSNHNCVHDAVSYMIGDLKFLSMMLGKENFDGYWCYLCKLCHPEWQAHGYACGDLWNLDGLGAQAELAGNLEGKERMGVREAPYFDITVHRYIWPVLHTLIGVGNAILDYLIDIVESEIQAIPAKEI